MTLFGIDIEVRPVQPLKADVPIEVTLLGITIDVRLFIPLQQLVGMAFTDSPKVNSTIGQSLNTSLLLREQLSAFHTTDVRPEQPLKAPEPIFITPLGISTEFKPTHPLNALFPIDVIRLGIFTEVRLVHPLKADCPIVVALFGIDIEVRPVHPVKA